MQMCFFHQHICSPWTCSVLCHTLVLSYNTHNLVSWLVRASNVWSVPPHRVIFYWRSTRSICDEMRKFHFLWRDEGVEMKPPLWIDDSPVKNVYGHHPTFFRSRSGIVDGDYRRCTRKGWHGMNALPFLYGSCIRDGIVPLNGSFPETQ